MPIQTVEQIFNYRPNTTNLIVAGMHGQLCMIKQQLADLEDLPEMSPVTRIALSGVRQYKDINDIDDFHGSQLTVYFVEVDDPLGQVFKMLDEIVAVDYFRRFDSVDLIYSESGIMLPSKYRIKHHGEYLGIS